MSDYAIQYAKSLNDEAAFHAAMHSRPEDNVPPLVYADWLEEHDRPTHAEMIRHHIDRYDEPFVNDGNYPRMWSPRRAGETEVHAQQGGVNHSVVLTMRSHTDPQSIFTWARPNLLYGEATSLVRRLTEEGATPTPYAMRQYLRADANEE